MIETKDDFVKTFKAARRVSTPLMAVRTPDPASSIQAVRLAHDAATGTPLLHWDIGRAGDGGEAERRFHSVFCQCTSLFLGSCRGTGYLELTGWL